MSKRLVILSDIWGCKKGLWITSYLGYLQSYFDITFYDCRELGYVDMSVSSEGELHNAFLDGGMDAAVKHLLKKEQAPAHYLTFCAGSTIAWKAALQGLPIKCLYAVSPFNLQASLEKPEIPVNLLYGEYQKLSSSEKRTSEAGLVIETMPNFGHELYTDEKIIQKICLDLLENHFNVSFKAVS